MTNPQLQRRARRCDARLVVGLDNGPRLALVARATAIVVGRLASVMLVSIGAEAVGIELFDALRG